MPATSHRQSFERWLCNWGGYEVAEVREQRSEFGYERPDWDLAFVAYKEGVTIERGRRKFLARRASSRSA